MLPCYRSSSVLIMGYRISLHCRGQDASNIPSPGVILMADVVYYNEVYDSYYTLKENYL